MAVEVERLLVTLEGRITQYEKAMAKATGVTDRTARNIERRFNRAGTSMNNSLGGAITKVNRALGALGIGIGAGILLRIGREALDAAGGLGELSQQLGVSTDLLQALQFAASQSGVTSRELETSLTRLTRTIGEAVEGETEAVEAFELGGIAFADYSGQARLTEDVLRDVAQRIKEAKTDAERAAIAYNIFGRSGQRLIPILLGGARGLDDFIARAKELGLVLDDEASAAADRASDKLVELEQRFGKLSQRIAAAVAGPLTEFIALMERAGDLEIPAIFSLTGPGAILSAGNRIGAGIDDSLFGDPDPFNTGSDRGTTLNTGTPRATPRPDTDAASAAASEAEKRAEAIQKVIAALQLEFDNLGRTNEQQRIYNELSRAGVELATAEGAQIATLVTEIERRVAAAEELTAAVEAEQVLMDERRALTESLRTPQEIHAAQIARLNELYPEAARGAETYARAVKFYADELAAATGTTAVAIEETTDAILDQDTAARTAQSGISGLISDLGRGENAMDSFANAVRGVIDQLAQLLLNRAILSLFGSLFGGGGSGIVGSVAGSLIGGSFHSGGIVGRDRMQHSGDLKRNERLAVLETGEEVLTRNDPRHRFNLGAVPRLHNGGLAGQLAGLQVPSPAGRSAVAAAPAPRVEVPVRIFNGFNASALLAEAMSTPAGERVMFNWVRNNPGAVNQALGRRAR